MPPSPLLAFSRVNVFLFWFGVAGLDLARETPLHLFQRLNQDLLLMFTKQYALFTIYDNKK
jgi:hypothetical protein